MIIEKDLCGGASTKEELKQNGEILEEVKRKRHGHKHGEM